MISAVCGPEIHSHLPHPLAPVRLGNPWHFFFSFLEAAFLLLMFQRAEKKRSHGVTMRNNNILTAQSSKSKKQHKKFSYFFVHGGEVRLFHRQPYIGKNNFSDLHSEGKLQKKKNSSRSNNFQEQIYMHQKNLRG